MRYWVEVRGSGKKHPVFWPVTEIQFICGLLFHFLFVRLRRDLPLGDACSGSLHDFRPGGRLCLQNCSWPFCINERHWTCILGWSHLSNIKVAVNSCFSVCSKHALLRRVSEGSWIYCQENIPTNHYLQSLCLSTQSLNVQVVRGDVRFVFSS